MIVGISGKDTRFYIKKSHNHFKTGRFWKLLKHLAEKQNFRCVYSGEKLIPGKNMSLDHIISQKDDPSLKYDFKNVQWVTKDINSMKNKMSHGKFVEICSYVYKKFNKEL